MTTTDQQQAAEDALSRLADLAATGDDERDDEVATLYARISVALRRALTPDEQPKLSLIGRDRVWLDKLAKSLRTDIGELGTISETPRGCTFEIRYGPNDLRYIARVVVELNRIEARDV